MFKYGDFMYVGLAINIKTQFSKLVSYQYYVFQVHKIREWMNFKNESDTRHDDLGSRP